MNRKLTLGALLAVMAAAPAIVTPNLVSQASAQTTRDSAEFPDVPKNHWAYEAINKLAAAGIIEGRDGGNYVGNAPMTRYEFAVAIARLLDKIQPSGTSYDDTAIRGQIAGLDTRVTSLENGRISRQEVLDLIAALRTEFADELSRLGVRVGDLETRVDTLEKRTVAPPRLTTSLSFLHRTGSANYIEENGPGGSGRSIFNGDNAFGTAPPALPRNNVFAGGQQNFTNGKFAYTDFELRLTDRVTDRLSVNAAIRSLGDTQEDPWAGQTNSIVGNGVTGPYVASDGGGGISVREANAVVDLGGRSYLGAKGLSLILGRQHTKIGQGLMYDNDLSPTDQLQAQFNVGPFQVSGFIGSSNNNTAVGPLNPYLTTGAVRWMGLSGNNGSYFGGPVGFGTSQADINRSESGAVVGFPGLTAPTVATIFGPTTVGAAAVPVYRDNNESLVRVGFNLFRIAGNPVVIGLNHMDEGIARQAGDSVDLSIPLFNRTVGVEYVRERKYANGISTSGSPSAYNVTLPILRTRVIDLNAAYGHADNDFEYFISSSANPFARTYGEALFDRPMALGAPMIGGNGNSPTYMAAKRVYDISGTLRLIKKLPLDFRYYRAYGTKATDGFTSDDLGSVFSVGSTFNVSPGLDLEVKYGQYDPKLNGYQTIKYFRVGANVGF